MTLTGLAVTDTVNPAPVCPGGALSPGQSMACASATTMATLPGAYSSSATATARAAIPAAFVAAGGSHSCVVTQEGVAWCWGSNGRWQLGSPEDASDVSARHVNSFEEFVQVDAGGEHTCAVSVAGSAYCWGAGSSGQLGDSTLPFLGIPTQVAGSLSFAFVSAGGTSSCGVTLDGEVYCWGNGANGLLGNNSTAGSATPVEVAGPNGPYIGVTVGTDHACVLSIANEAYCFGANTYGQLGITVGQAAATAPVGGSHLFAELAAGAGFTCGRDVDGVAWCWGAGTAGQLGNGASVKSTTPVQVGGGLTFSVISAGGSGACGIAEGELWCWGSATASDEPVRVGGGADWVSVAVGTNHRCARDGEGGVACWGLNSSGQLGDGSLLTHTAPTPSFLPMTDTTSDSASLDAQSQPSRILTVTRLVNSKPAETAPGVESTGDLSLLYTVRNSGQLLLRNVTISDPDVALNCSGTEPRDLATGESFVCTATVPQLAPGTTWQSTASATADWDDVDHSHETASITATSTAYAWSDAEPALTLTATANGVSAAGTGAEVGDGPVTMLYTVENVSPLTVTDVKLLYAPGALACVPTALDPGDTATCSTTITSPAAGESLTISPRASATATKPDGSTETATVSATATVWRDATPSLSITAQIGSPPAPSTEEPGVMFPAGANIPVRFVVDNTGPVELSDLELTVVGPDGSPITGVSCPTTSFEEPVVCAGTILAARYPTAGELTGTATATWTNPGGTVKTATDSDGAWLYTEAEPQLLLEMQVSNLAPADNATSPGAPINPYLDFAVNYKVTNTGEVALDEVLVSVGGDELSCPASLAIGASATCAASFSGLAPGEAFTSVGTASAAWTSPISAIKYTATATDTVYTWGFAKPSIALDARIAATPRPTAPGAKVNPGSRIYVNLVVTNTGPVPVANPTAAFTVPGLTCPFVPSGPIAPGATAACSAELTAPGGGTQLSFAPIVTAGWVRPGGVTVSATASAGLYAWVDEVPSLTLAARIGTHDANTAPGVEVPVGNPVAMTYRVTNTSDVALTGLVIADAALSVNCPVTTLAAGSATTCTATRPAPTAGATIAASATATATWAAPDGTTRTASATDLAHAWTDATPALSLMAAVGSHDADVAPGPRQPAGVMVLRSVVTNTGPVTVSGIAVTDAQAGTLGCPASTLAAGASMTCTTTEAAPAPGAQWASVGTVTGSWTNPAGTVRSTTASDPVHAWGAADITLALTTRLGGLGASLPPGLRVAPNEPVAVTYTVTNTSTVRLADLALTAAGTSGLSCPATALAAGASMDCTATLTAPAGGNVAAPGAQVTGRWVDPTGDAHTTTATDTAYLWTPGLAGILTTFRVNGRADAGNGVAVHVGDPAQVAVLVYNTGNVLVRDLSVTTNPGIGLDCPATELAVDGVMACTATITGPDDGTSITISARTAGVWSDPVAGRRTQLDYTDQIIVFGSAGAPDPIVTLDPARLFESRPGESTVDGQQNAAGRLGDGATVVVHVAGRGGVPDDAASAVLNLTATGAAGPGFVTVWPCTSVQPVASNLNYRAGETVANTVVAQLDENGDVCLYALRATDLIVDVNGYADVGGLETLNPARLLDTRSAHPTIDGRQAGTGALPAQGEVRIQVTGRGAVPIDATAAVLNVIATDPAGDGYLTVYPCGTTPNASMVNYTAGSTATNSVVAKLDPAGGVCVFTHAAAHIVVDVNGFARATTGVSAVVPARLVDTRAGGWQSVDGDQAGGGLVQGGTSLRVRVAGRGGVPVGVGTVMLNLVALDAQTAGYLTAYPCSAVPPAASNLNFEANRIVANSAIVQVDEQGDVCLFAYADTNVLVDVTGYVEPRL